jgi:hypothetical protein
LTSDCLSVRSSSVACASGGVRGEHGSMQWCTMRLCRCVLDPRVRLAARVLRSTGRRTCAGNERRGGGAASRVREGPARSDFVRDCPNLPCPDACYRRGKSSVAAVPHRDGPHPDHPRGRPARRSADAHVGCFPPLGNAGGQGAVCVEAGARGRTQAAGNGVNR